MDAFLYLYLGGAYRITPYDKCVQWIQWHPIVTHNPRNYKPFMTFYDLYDLFMTFVTYFYAINEVTLQDKQQ